MVSAEDLKILTALSEDSDLSSLVTKLVENAQFKTIVQHLATIADDQEKITTLLQVLSKYDRLKKPLDAIIELA